MGGPSTLGDTVVVTLPESNSSHSAKTHPEVLRLAAALFIPRPSEAISREELATALGDRMPHHWTTTQDALEEIFRHVWRNICLQATRHLNDEADPRDALSSAFRVAFEVLL